MFSAGSSVSGFRPPWMSFLLVHKCNYSSDYAAKMPVFVSAALLSPCSFIIYERGIWTQALDVSTRWTYFFFFPSASSWKCITAADVRETGLALQYRVWPVGQAWEIGILRPLVGAVMNLNNLDHNSQSRTDFLRHWGLTGWPKVN